MPLHTYYTIRARKDTLFSCWRHIHLRDCASAGPEQVNHLAGASPQCCSCQRTSLWLRRPATSIAGLPVGHIIVLRMHPCVHLSRSAFWSAIGHRKRSSAASSWNISEVRSPKDASSREVPPQERDGRTSREVHHIASHQGTSYQR